MVSQAGVTRSVTISNGPKAIPATASPSTTRGLGCSSIKSTLLAAPIGKPKRTVARVFVALELVEPDDDVVAVFGLLHRLDDDVRRVHRA